MALIRSLVAAGRGERRGRALPPLSGAGTAAGVVVSPERSLQIAAVYSCVAVITEAVGMLPMHAFERSPGGGRRQLEADEEPMLALLGPEGRPNPAMDAGELWRQMTGFQLLRGNAFAVVDLGGDGRPRGLWPVAPTSVRVERARDGGALYLVRLAQGEHAPGLQVGVEQALARHRVLHLRAFGLGLLGYSPVRVARQGIGIAFAAEAYGAALFANGGYPGGVLQAQGAVDDEVYERLMARWEAAHRGFARAHRPAVLEGGLSWQQVGLPPEDAQFLETRRFARQEIAGMFGVPPHMIGDLDRSTSWGTGIEQQSLGFVAYTLDRWLVRAERALAAWTGPGRYWRFNRAALLRGDLKSRYEAYAVGRQWGFLSANDVKRREDEDPIGTAGDAYWQPLNMVEAGTAQAGTGGPARAGSRGSRAAPGGLRSRHVEALRGDLEAYFGAQREALLAGLRAEAGGGPDAELALVLLRRARAAAGDGAALVAEAFGSQVDEAAMEGWLRANAAAAAAAINAKTSERIGAAAAEPGVGAAEAIAGVMAERIGSDALRLAIGRTTLAWAFGRHEAARGAGGRSKTWIVLSPNPRPSHALMAGETVGMEEVFSNGGRWPGDPSLSADEVAGCTCDVEFG